MILDYERTVLDVESGDKAGLLVFRGDALLAVVTRLSDFHGDRAGWWFVECLFHPTIAAPRDPFPSIEALDAWLGEQTD